MIFVISAFFYIDIIVFAKKTETNNILDPFNFSIDVCYEDEKVPERNSNAISNETLFSLLEFILKYSNYITCVFYNKITLL